MPSPGIGTPQCLGSAQYGELDPSPDNCGDTIASSTVFSTVELDGVTCPAVGNVAVNLPDCTTWQVPGKTILCEDTDTTNWPFNNAAIPGTPSKCNCGTVSIPITPINPTISATKTPNPKSRIEPGGTFTYTVVVKNTTAGSVDVTINQLCDDQFGNIATATTTPAQPDCPAGTLGSATNITCPLPATLAQNGTVTCTFDGSVTGAESGPVKDTVTANGIGSGVPVQATASATVTIGEAAAKAQVLKTLDGAQECAIARYKIEVDNLSDTGTDETETLTKLFDVPFGDITKLGSSSLNPTIVGTTCGVDSGSPGLGTLSGVAGAGVLGVIDVQSNYTCEFDGKFCAALGSAGSCTTGLENKDTVTATLIKEDGFCSGGTNAGNLCFSNADCPSGTCPLQLKPTATLTVDSCFSHTP